MGLGKKTIDDQNYCGKKVLVRCDFNVPMKDGVITNAATWANPRMAPRQSSAWHPLLWL